jgi:hypothetical protein
MSGRASLGADDGECRNFHRSARAPPATRRHAGHTRINYDTAGHTPTSRLCRVPAIGGEQKVVVDPVVPEEVRDRVVDVSEHAAAGLAPGWTRADVSSYVAQLAEPSDLLDPAADETELRRALGEALPPVRQAEIVATA